MIPIVLDQGWAVHGLRAIFGLRPFVQPLKELFQASYKVKVCHGCILMYRADYFKVYF